MDQPRAAQNKDLRRKLDQTPPDERQRSHDLRERGQRSKDHDLRDRINRNRGERGKGRRTNKRRMRSANSNAAKDEWAPDFDESDFPPLKDEAGTSDNPNEVLDWAEEVNRAEEERQKSLRREIDEYRRRMEKRGIVRELPDNKVGIVKGEKIVEIEVQEETLLRRQKQIDYGKNTVGYSNYQERVPKKARQKTDPRTPNKFLKVSRRSWDAQVREWRRTLHNFDPSGQKCDISDISDSVSVASDAATAESGIGISQDTVHEDQENEEFRRYFELDDLSDASSDEALTMDIPVEEREKIKRPLFDTNRRSTVPISGSFVKSPKKPVPADYVHLDTTDGPELFRGEDVFKKTVDDEGIILLSPKAKTPDSIQKICDLELSEKFDLDLELDD